MDIICSCSLNQKYTFKIAFEKRLKLVEFLLAAVRGFYLPTGLSIRLGCFTLKSRIQR